MRTDYILYIVAVIFFAITGIVAVSQVDFQQLWIVGTAVLGLFFIGLGYTQKPRATMSAAPPPMTPAPAPSPAPTAAPASTLPMVVEETKKEEAPAVIPPTPTAPLELVQVKGVKAKRAEQLKGLGIGSVHDLANASPEDLAKKLRISSKFTQQWIDSAKELVSKS